MPTTKTFVMISNNGALKMTFEIKGDEGMVDYRATSNNDIMVDPFFAKGVWYHSCRLYTVEELRELWKYMRTTPYWDKGDIMLRAENT